MGFGFTNGTNGNEKGDGMGTEFLNMLSPPKSDIAEYDNTRPFSKQAPSIPQVFLDAMSVREEVYGEQGIALEAEFDEDDARSWHWVVYASVASRSNSLPADMRTKTFTSADEDKRRASASASRLPVGTIRLVRAPHSPNKYVRASEEVDKHPDADPPPSLASQIQEKHPTEPYVKLGRLAVLAPYRKLGLSKLLINSALEYAAKNPNAIYQPPSPTTIELANLTGMDVKKISTWQGLVMIHAQASLEKMWTRYGFAEELLDKNGNVEISREARWIEEGIEHISMWKRLKIDSRRL
ncbi:hypothetical protein B0J11DRAFT_512062 [Dendryphion nanum]|uniref:Glucosamine 6-phosphate N-acetyltransferase n=1 Tax=Dendryphion nanum TaxID=256645 RepID=A0A9P9D3H9_9PLEO|nr:hypothetical protein B0J11DRAFT_512062 [Dendryphion nanum]